MTSSVDGLVSGLNTTQLIAQLVKAESGPQQALQSKVKTVQNVQSALQSVNSKLAALQSAANALTKDSAWNTVQATSSFADAAAVTATSGASASDFTFDITALAKAGVVMATLAPGAVIDRTGGNDGVDITIGATTTHIAVTADTAQGVVDAINAKKLNVRAALVTTDQGTVLQLSATKSGLANAAGITGLQATAHDVVAAADAQIKVGTGIPATGGYTVSSASNTFANVMPGMTVTAKQLQNGVTVSVTADAAAIADKMATMVNAANSALADIAAQTAYDPVTKKAGTLLSNSAVRSIQQKVLSGVGAGGADYGSYQQLGVELTSGGNLTFDRAAFLAAYEANPTATKTAVAEGLARQLDTIAAAASDKTSGTVTLTIQNGDTFVRSLNAQITTWDSRLKTRQDALQRQFGNLEVALGKLKNQSSWLAGQIATLPTGN